MTTTGDETARSSARSLPDFVVIGAAKSGTTSLRHYLCQHPQLFLPNRGEPSFFAHLDGDVGFSGPGDDEWAFVTDANEYGELFAGADDAQVTGEISPRYLFFEQAAPNLAELAARVKIVAILRHPVDRAYSHYSMNRSRGCEPDPSFVSALDKSSERWSRGWGWDWMYTELGLYAQQLRRYFELFDPSQIAVFIYEEWVADPDRFYAQLFGFLGVDPTFLPDTQRRERTASVPRSSRLAGVLRRSHRGADALRVVTPPSVRRMIRRSVESVNDTMPTRLEPTLRDRLYETRFAADVATLETMVGRPIECWRAGV